MANIQINLFEELANIFRQDLEDLGYSTTSLRTPEEVTMMYVTTYERLVSKRVRSIEFANGFQVPSHLQSGFDLLCEKFRNGCSVYPHLSRTTDKMDFQDKMLFDWGIHHFHLGTVIENDGYVNRTGDVLYAIVSEDKVRCLVIQPHNHWADKDLLEIVLANWPELLETWRTR